MTELVFTRIPITGLPELKCNVRMDKLGRTLDSDGDPLPFERRPYECDEDGVWMLGAQPLCERHFYETCHLVELDPEGIGAEWRSML